MPYWVYGTKGGQPMDPLYLEAVSHDVARAEAGSLGWQVDFVVHVPPRRRGEPPPPAEERPAGRRGPLLAGGLVWLFRGMALVAAALTSIVALVQVETVKAVGQAGAAGLVTTVLWGVLVVGALLAVGEGLRLLVTVEANTRTAPPSPQVGPGSRGSRAA